MIPDLNSHGLAEVTAWVPGVLFDVSNSDTFNPYVNT